MKSGGKRANGVGGEENDRFEEGSGLIRAKREEGEFWVCQGIIFHKKKSEINEGMRRKKKRTF